MRVFFNALVVQILLNLYVFWKGWEVLPKSKWVRIPFVSIFIIEFLAYLTGFLFHDDLSLTAIHDVAWIGTSWMIFLGYMSAPLLIYDLLKYINKKKHSIPIDLQSLKIKRIYFFSVLILVLGTMGYGNYRFYNPIVNEMTLHIDKYSPDVKELKVVVVSDIHVGYLINRDILKMYVDRIMEQKPDMILIPGDIIDYDMKPLIEQNMGEEFQRLKAPYGVYATTGNHEYIYDADEGVKWLEEKAGLTVLRDTAILVNNSFYVVGRDDDKSKNRKPLSQIMQGVDRTYPIFVINHEPHRLQEEADAGADIAVYGHTHNGQVFPANILVKMLYEVAHGYKKKDNTHIYVSSGLGLAGPQYRIGTISEIVVLDVKFDK